MVDFWPAAKPAVKTAITALDAEYACRVSDRMPKTRPAQAILVSQIDASIPNPAQSVHRLLIECWADPYSLNVEEWANGVAATMANLRGKTIDGVFIFGWSNQHGPVFFPDPDVTDMDRWQLHGDFTLSTK